MHEGGCPCRRSVCDLQRPQQPSPACEKSAADKKLAGAAKNAHIKKCMADAKPA